VLCVRVCLDFPCNSYLEKDALANKKKLLLPSFEESPRYSQKKISVYEIQIAKDSVLVHLHTSSKITSFVSRLSPYSLAPTSPLFSCVKELTFLAGCR